MSRWSMARALAGLILLALAVLAAAPGRGATGPGPTADVPYKGGLRAR